MNIYFLTFLLIVVVVLFYVKRSNTTKDYRENLMLDLETLGTTPGCVILSVAVVPFNLSIEPFYVRISLEDSKAKGFKVDRETEIWWSNQNKEAFIEASTGTAEVIQVLEDLSKYLGNFKKIAIWGNSASFDCGILKEYYIQMGIPVPWSHYDERDYRTLYNLVRNKVKREYLSEDKAHNALNDALQQAKHAKKILEYFGNKLG